MHHMQGTFSVQNTYGETAIKTTQGEPLINYTVKFIFHKFVIVHMYSVLLPIWFCASIHSSQQTVSAEFCKKLGLNCCE